MSMSGAIGRRALVMGTSGFGFEIALALARAGASVTLAGRAREQSEVNRMIDKLKGATDWSAARYRRGRAKEDPYNHRFVEVDYTDLRTVRRAARECLQKGGAGVPDWLVMGHAVNGLALNRTRDGFHEGLQIHYLTRILLTRLLVDAMCEESLDPRIMTMLGTVDYDEGMGQDEFLSRVQGDMREGRNLPQKKFEKAVDGWLGIWQRGKAYRTASLYTDLFFHRLSEEFGALAVIHADLPVVPHADFGKGLPMPLRHLARALAKVHPASKSADEAAVGLVTTFLSSAPGYHLVDKDGKSLPLADNVKEGKFASDYVWRRTLGLLELAGWKEQPGWKQRGEEPAGVPPEWDMSLEGMQDLSVDMRRALPQSMPAAPGRATNPGGDPDKTT